MKTSIPLDQEELREWMAEKAEVYATPQSRLGSVVESVLNVGSGFVVGALLWSFVVAPLWDYDVTLLDSLGIPAMFTIVSVARTYV